MSAADIASILLQIKAVHLRPDEPFTWTSGIKSPIYCDNRQIISYPKYRKTVAQAFASIIQEKYHGTQVIAGTATAGIPHAAWVADLLELPMIYVRSSSKGHGLQNLIEGHCDKGQKVILIEDLISTGKSSLAALEALEQRGLEVLSTLAIFSYQTNKAIDAFAKISASYQALCSIDELVEVAADQKIVTLEQKQHILNFVHSL